MIPYKKQQETVWVVGFTNSEKVTEWLLCGIFDERIDAVAGCLDENHFILEILMNTRREWWNVLTRYFPKAKEVENGKVGTDNR